MEILEGKGIAVVQLGLGIRLHGVAVEHHVADVDILGGEGHVVAVGGRAHGKEKASTHHEVAYLVHHGQFQLAHLAESQFLGGGLLGTHVFDVPLRVAVVAPELAVLAGEVLVVQVEPVVFGQDARHDLLVVDHVVGNFGVGEHEGHGVVPRQFVLGRIDGNLGGFLQLHGVHVDRRLGNVRKDGA